MNSTPRPYRLLAPGPVPVPAAVLRAMSEKVLHHRTPHFLAILNEVWAGLEKVFATRQPVQIITGTGSAAMEAAVANTLKSGDHALVVVSGKFGERWADMCERFGVHTTRFHVPWGEALDLDLFAKSLQGEPQLRAVLTQACETSTATVHPIREMAQLVRRHRPEALFEVDAITAVGCMDLPMDEWGLDVVVAGSQKAFMIPTGLSFIALSERAWQSQPRSTAEKYYFDLAAEKKANSKGDSQFSIPTPLVMGLGVVLRALSANGGLEQLKKRCALLSRVTREVAPTLGLGVYSKCPSNSVTALTTSRDSAEIRDWLEREHNITVMGGQDQLKGKVLRIGHMGDVRDDDMLALFDALAEKLGRQTQWQNVRPTTAQQLQSVETLF